VRGPHVGSYLPSSGVWHRTQRYLKRNNADSTIVKHVDFDAPTREGAQLLPDDKVGYCQPLPIYREDPLRGPKAFMVHIIFYADARNVHCSWFHLTFLGPFFHLFELVNFHVCLCSCGGRN
jgi:hypothetical protein